MTFICILTFVSCVVAYEQYESGFSRHSPGPLYPATKGSVWPKPQQQETLSDFHVFLPANMMIKITQYKCPILISAIKRHMDIMTNLSKTAKRYKLRSTDQGLEEKSVLKQLLINLTLPCEDYPYFNMHEKYNLRVSTSSQLTSKSIWGILLGLETLSQLYYMTDDCSEIRINETTIEDFPSYPHRGLMLDTARHYISVENILKNLDAMAMNKMNVFHWHIVDDESFPYQSSNLPDLSRLGAFHPRLVYTQSQIKTIIHYARDRGIRVLPEFDVPGHTASWGLSHPNILTECDQNLGPLHPLKPATYKLLKTLYTELKSVFVDKYMHLGGDEVDLQCWLSNRNIENYMYDHNITNGAGLQANTMNRILKLLDKSITPIVWEEAFNNLPRKTVVQVWKPNWIETMVEVLTKNRSLILSSPWYLDDLNRRFTEMYDQPPRDYVREMISKKQLKLVIGGEACMWAETVDNTNVLSRIWPRASALAELLWSPYDPSLRITLPGELPKDRVNIESLGWSITLHRAEEHACRMQRRGVPASPPAGPGFCLI